MCDLKPSTYLMQFALLPQCFVLESFANWITKIPSAHTGNFSTFIPELYLIIHVTSDHIGFYVQNNILTALV